MIDLYTAGTPNEWKASMALEELGLDYSVHPVNLGDREQKKPWWSGVDIAGLNDLEGWISEIAARPAVQRGREIPEPQEFKDGNDKLVNEARSMLG